MRIAMTTTILLAVLMNGCAANVRKASETSTVKVPAESSKKVVLNITGNKSATGSSDWEQFKGEWRGALKTEAQAAGASFAVQEDEPKPIGEDGTLVVVFINDYRYVSPGARYGFGVMTGNAFIDSKISFTDLKSGRSFGQQVYNTSSTAWQGIFSAMTEKQVQAISKEIMTEIKPR